MADRLEAAKLELKAWFEQELEDWCADDGMRSFPTDELISKAVELFSERWRPIESAPHGLSHPYDKSDDAAQFVLIWNGHHVGVAWHEYIHDEHGIASYWHGEDGTFEGPDPTHWMPLPSPPEEA